MEGIDSNPLEWVGAIGVCRVQLIRFGVLRESAKQLLSLILYIFDDNMRQKSMLGLKGAGGIGYELQSAFRMFEYPRVAAIIIVIFMTIFIIDMLSSYIRSTVL